LPATVIRAKGIIHLEELPQYQIALQMVGKRYNFKDGESWGTAPPRSEIVLIASEGGFDPSDLQQRFDACIGEGDESQSPILRMSRRLATHGATKTHAIDRKPMD
jgi:G3E family GTPase